MTAENLHNKAIRLTSFFYSQMTENGTTSAIVETPGSTRLTREIEKVSANQGVSLIVENLKGQIHAKVKGI